jgi:hypothetical protein
MHPPAIIQHRTVVPADDKAVNASISLEPDSPIAETGQASPSNGTGGKDSKRHNHRRMGTGKVQGHAASGDR